MAFKLTYSDGHETEYDDSTKWEVDDGVVKLGRDEGDWTVYLSPSHWATLELDTGKEKDDGDKKSGDDKKSDKKSDDKKSDDDDDKDS